MFRPNKISRIGLLMIVSEILIAAFVFRWLQSEFNSEKMELQKNLFDQFISARSRVMDSMISKKYIEPILGRSGGFKIQTIDVKGKIPQERHGASQIQVYNQDTARFIVKSDSFTANEASLEMRIDGDTSVDVLHRGIKMLITRVSTEDSVGGIFEKHVVAGDTALLKFCFAQNLKDNHLPLKMVWVSNESENRFPPQQFYYETDFFEKPYGVVISAYNGFLFRKILPQMLFALLLLLITGAAFIFSYRSVKNQLKLAVMKDDFISNMSHELKTPVATMKVAVEAMQQMDPVEKKEVIKDYLGMAAQELNRLDLLINKVMNNILLDNGKQTLQLHEVNFNSLIEQTIKSMQIQLLQRNASINFIAEENDITGRADAIHVQGILYNLIDNGMKYGKESCQMLIHLSQTPTEVILKFSDNGPGIPEEFLDKIFDKFFRVPKGDQHNVKGYGLGLHYVQQIMKLHHGSVSVKNLDGNGIEFTLKFPK